tara:strand:- start:713 stop:1312 length:600 start_codon:yes stop_codon:yes gene_type:complete
MIDFITRYEGAFTKEECIDIIAEIEHFRDNNLLFNITDKTYLQEFESVNVNVDIIDFNSSSRISKKIFPKIKPCIDDYLQEYSLLGGRKFIISDCKLKRIGPGKGFHVWHYENGDYLSAHRTFVVQTYLNDDFEGGETEFLYQNKREKPRAGDVLIFPAGYTHVHRGNPPLGGVKYLATSWGMLQSTPEDTNKYRNAIT